MKKFVLFLLLAQNFFSASYIWFEGENPKETNFPESSWFAPQNNAEKEVLSGGDWLTADKKREGPPLYAKYEVRVDEENLYNFWVRKFYTHGPFKWRFDTGAWQICDKNVPLADNSEIRKFVCANWVFLGKTNLQKGVHLLEIELLAAEGEEMVSGFDCFILTSLPFVPSGKNKPGEKSGKKTPGYFAFEPEPDEFKNSALLDLSFLNEKEAGSKGFLKAKGSSFVFEKEDKPVKFWGVVTGENAVSMDRDSIRYLAKRLAKLGINIVRVHSAIFDKAAVNPAQIEHAYLDKLHFFVSAMKKEGIYTKLSFYFPLWFDIQPGYGLPGYESLENKKPFSLLFFHPRMQEIYRAWAKGLLSTVNPYTKLSFAEDPAIALVEIVNEDNYFFWTFKPYEIIPAECISILENKYFAWLGQKYGTIEKAKADWGAGAKVKGDDFAKERAGLYDAWFLTAGAKGRRCDKRAFDQAEFLTLELRNFFEKTRDWFKNELKVKCPITATNWTTADNATLGALDKYAAMACEVMDRHAYFDPKHKTDRGYTLSEGDTFSDMSVLLDPLSSPVLEQEYSGHPNIVTEICWNMPNRFRTEGPVLMAAYGSLQGTDAFFQFALNGAEWQNQLTKWASFTPETLGVSPACALIFRNNYIKEAPFSASYNYNLQELFSLKGNTLEQAANTDNLRFIEQGGTPKNGPALNALLGKIEVAINDKAGSTVFNPGNKNKIDAINKRISSLTKELNWDYKNGLVRINAPAAEGALGFLAAAGEIKLNTLTVDSKNEYGSVLAVALDGKALNNSEKLLVQIMTEDMNTGWETKGGNTKKIVKLGTAPIIVKEFSGSVSLQNLHAKTLKIKALDFNGYFKNELPFLGGDKITFNLLPDCMYYLIER